MEFVQSVPKQSACTHTRNLGMVREQGGGCNCEIIVKDVLLPS